MIPETDKSVRYSYRSFKPSELHYDGLMYMTELNRLDYVDFTDKSIAFIHNWLNDTFYDYRDDVFDDESHYKFYFLKEFVMKESIDKDLDTDGYQHHIMDYFSDDQTIDKYWRFYISDWNERDKINDIDSRTVTISLYTYDHSTDDYMEQISFMVKLDHIYQLIIDLRRLTDYLFQNPDEISGTNLYVLPVYIHQNRYFDGNKVRVSKRYRRISDKLFDEEPEFILQDLLWILAGTMRFAALNYKMVIADEKRNEASAARDRISNRRSLPRRRATEVAYKEATSDTRKKIDITLDDNVNLVVDIRRHNVYSRHSDDYVVTILDYKTQVHGFWNHYWYGSGDNKERKAKWIEPYYRNAHNRTRVTKEFEGADN